MVLEKLQPAHIIPYAQGPSTADTTVPTHTNSTYSYAKVPTRTQQNLLVLNRTYSYATVPTHTQQYLLVLNSTYLYAILVLDEEWIMRHQERDLFLTEL